VDYWTFYNKFYKWFFVFVYMTICQSCGVVLETNQFGTEEDGSKNQEYCFHCYRDGNFTFKGSFEDFLEKQIDISIENFGISEDEARKHAKEKLPLLNRWINESEKDNEDEEFDFLE
jgi:hypothetical protein